MAAILPASASASIGSTTYPVWPSSTWVTIPPTREPITGVACQRASDTTSPNPSRVDMWTKPRARRINEPTPRSLLSTFTQKRTSGSSPACACNCASMAPPSGSSSAVLPNRIRYGAGS